MKFCTIYKIEINEDDYKYNLRKVVSCRELSKEQLDNLADYFEENTPVARYTQQYNISTFIITNYDELLENSPLPDGTIVMDSKFEEGGKYVVVLGHTNNEVTEVNVTLKVSI